MDVHVPIRADADSGYKEYVARVELARVGATWQVTEAGPFVSLAARARQTQVAAQATATAAARTAAQQAAASLRAVQMLSPTEGWAVGDAGRILRYAAGQCARGPQPDPGRPRRPEPGLAHGRVGRRLTLLRYHAGAWTVAPDAPADQIAALQMLSAGEGWAVGAAGSIFHYQDRRAGRAPPRRTMASRWISSACA